MTELELLAILHDLFTSNLERDTLCLAGLMILNVREESCGGLGVGPEALRWASNRIQELEARKVVTREVQ